MANTTPTRKMKVNNPEKIISSISNIVLKGTKKVKDGWSKLQNSESFKKAGRTMWRKY